MLADLTSGRLTDPPFPEEATQRLRDYVDGLTKGVDIPTDPSQDLQPQPVDVLQLGRVLKLLGETEWAIMDTYATGVPLGLGVDLPRTPAVFPPKLRYSLKEQLEWGGASERAAAYKGAWRSNYSSAVGFAREVEKVLREQEAAGEMLVLPEAVARERYGDRLAVASLAALEKSVTEDGVTEVRVLHDGTHGVDTNRYIRVLDGGTSPTAQDLKTCMRHQAGRKRPHIGATLDIKGAHHVVVVRPYDWPLTSVPGRARGACLP